ncbi:peroxiredoxin [Burkholderiaceae bacterium DAT-1]|nr:peroxiredoxin [Burkholderiaceae bacterium DAT-1]
MIEPGTPAPDFELPDASMDMVRLSDYRGQKIVVLYFYHHDNAPGCTREAIEFSDLADQFEKAGSTVVGVSLDDPLCHEDFRDQHGLLVRLLSDPDCVAANLYDAVRILERDGMVKSTFIRSTFVIDRNGIVRHALYNVTPRGHAAEVLKLILQLNAEANSLAQSA